MAEEISLEVTVGIRPKHVKVGAPGGEAPALRLGSPSLQANDDIRPGFALLEAGTSGNRLLILP